MDYKLVAETAMLAGRIMLESNAETYRVEETIAHILKTADVTHAEVFALPTGIMLTLNDAQLHTPISLISRVQHRSTDLRKIHKVNHISRELTARNMTIHQAHQLLITLDEQEYSQLQVDIAIMALAIFFTVMLGGHLIEALITCLNAIVLVLLWRVCRFFKIDTFFSNVIGSLAMAIIATLFVKWLPNQVSLDAIMIGSIMPMVPGTIITNAIRDTFHGDYTSGTIRAIEAIMIALSIALGVALGLLFAGGGNLS